jgi:mycofactocin biosynthetic radical S-adenosylmethionine protein MftC
VYSDTITRKVGALRLLHSATLELTYACDLSCFYCYNDPGRKGSPLSLAQYRTLLEDLASMQTLFLMLTGGEPMMHPRFFDIGRMTRELGFVVRVRTNGNTLTSRNVERLQNEVDPYMVEVTLHGADAGTHDRQTRVPGSFDRLIRHLRYARSAGLRCGMITTPTAWNEHQIEEMMALSDELDIPLRFQGPVGPRDNGDTEPLSIQPSPETWDRVEALVTERRERQIAETKDMGGPDGGDESIRINKRLVMGGSKQTDESGGSAGTVECLTAETIFNPATEPPASCGVGLAGVDIDPFGNVQACIHLKESAGNLHQQAIADIWNHSPLFARVRQQAIDAAAKWGGDRPRQFGAPLFCIGVAENCVKGHAANKHGRCGRP